MTLAVPLTSAIAPTRAEAFTRTVRTVSALRNAIRDARNNGPSRDTINVRFSSTPNDGGEILVNTSVVISGNTFATTQIRNADNRGTIMRITADNVLVRNMTFRATRIDGFSHCIALGPDVRNLTIVRCRFVRHASAIDMGGGAPPRGVRIDGNQFIGNDNAIWFRRDTGRISGGADPLVGGRYLIRNNTVDGAGGFVFDNGNDGNEFVSGSVTFAAPGFVGSSLSPSVTEYADGSVISGNTMTGIQAFGVALAKCRNIDILNNNISMATASRFGGAIQLEHRTRDILIEDNTLNTVAGKQGLHLVTFTDHGSPRSFANGVRRVQVLRNTFTGGGDGLLFGGFADVQMIGNTFRNATNNNFRIANAPGGTSRFSANRDNTGAPGGRIPRP